MHRGANHGGAFNIDLGTILNGLFANPNMGGNPHARNGGPAGPVSWNEIYVLSDGITGFLT